MELSVVIGLGGDDGLNLRGAAIPDFVLASLCFGGDYRVGKFLLTILGNLTRLEILLVFGLDELKKEGGGVFLVENKFHDIVALVGDGPLGEVTDKSGEVVSKGLDVVFAGGSICKRFLAHLVLKSLVQKQGKTMSIVVVYNLLKEKKTRDLGSRTCNFVGLKR